jgi:hypothetical protein
MQASDYKAKREEVLKDPEVARAEKVAAAVEMVKAGREKERLEKEREQQERQQREEAKRERLKRELHADAGASESVDGEEGGEGKKKKKKKKAVVGGTLSFDAEDDG